MASTNDESLNPFPLDPPPEVQGFAPWNAIDDGSDWPPTIRMVCITVADAQRILSLRDSDGMNDEDRTENEACVERIQAAIKRASVL